MAVSQPGDRYIAKTNFTAGQWSSELAGRVDLEQFNNAVKTLRNWRVVPRGGVKTRPGTRFVARAKFHNLQTRLVGFEFNVEQAYIIEMGDMYMRFYVNNARLERAAFQITNATNNGSGLIRLTTSVTHNVLNGTHVAVRNVHGTYEANGDWEVSGATATTMDLVGSTFIHGYTSTATDTVAEIIELSTPYNDEDVFEFKFAQQEDTMYIFHPLYETRKLTRIGAQDFQLDLVDWKNGPFLPLNTTSITMTPSVTTGTGTLTASSAYFTTDHVGSLFLVGTKVGGVQGYVKITGFTSTTVVNMTVQATLSGTGATLVWAEGAWNKINGFLGAGMFYENRLVGGRTIFQPQTLWGSVTGQFENFDLSDITASNGYSYDIVSREANIIHWLSGEDVLIVGTSGREHKLTGGNDSGITPTNVFARPQTKSGCFDTEPVETSSGVVFVQRAQGALHLITFNFESDKYRAEDLNLLSNKILNGKVKEIAYEANPEETIWCALEDGELASLTLLPEQNVIAWAIHDTATRDASLVTLKSKFKSIESIFHTSGRQVWALVERTLTNPTETKQYIEFFDPAIFVDCAAVQTFNPAVTQITSGLEYIHHQYVQVVGDNAVYDLGDTTSSLRINSQGGLGGTEKNPAILNPSVTTIQVGLPISDEIEFFQPDRELQDGHTTGRDLKIVQVVLSVDSTLGLEVNGDQEPIREVEDAMDTAVPSETGLLKFVPDLDWNEPVKIKQTQPLPAHILAAFMFVNIGD